MKYTKIPIDTFKKLQMNVGVLLDSFTPSDGEVNDSSIIGATTDGISFSAKAEYTDFGEDIDNCPNNTKELKRKRYTTAVCSGTFVTVDSGAAKRLVGGADADSSDPAKVTPRNDLVDDDFEDLWLVGDYSDVNEDGAGSKKAGFIAIHMMVSLFKQQKMGKVGLLSSSRHTIQSTSWTKCLLRSTSRWEVQVANNEKLSQLQSYRVFSTNKQD